MKTILLALIILFLIPVSFAAPATYRALVDSDYGFYRVVDITMPNVSSGYDAVNHTLWIQPGDTVEFMNDATPDEQLTIKSNDGLWNDSAGAGILRWNYQKYDYTFNNTGEYTFSLKEYPRIANMKVEVMGKISVLASPTPTMTPEITATPTTIPTATLTPTPVPTQTQKSPGFEIYLSVAALILVFLKYKR
jgi:plastocyanin